jgi:transcriptional regulator with XRE-family HTH domain
MGHQPSPNTTVADLFRAAQQRAGSPTNKAFAERIGLCENHYNAVLRGKRLPKPTTLRDVARKAGISARALVQVAALERAGLDRVGIVIDTVEQAQAAIEQINAKRGGHEHEHDTPALGNLPHAGENIPGSGAA